VRQFLTSVERKYQHGGICIKHVVLKSRYEYEVIGYEVQRRGLLEERVLLQIASLRIWTYSPCGTTIRSKSGRKYVKHVALNAVYTRTKRVVRYEIRSRCFCSVSRNLSYLGCETCCGDSRIEEGKGRGARTRE